MSIKYIAIESIIFLLTSFIQHFNLLHSNNNNMPWAVCLAYNSNLMRGNRVIEVNTIKLNIEIINFNANKLSGREYLVSNIIFRRIRMEPQNIKIPTLTNTVYFMSKYYYILIVTPIIWSLQQLFFVPRFDEFKSYHDHHTDGCADVFPLDMVVAIYSYVII